jgi:hypothetical protein
LGQNQWQAKRKKLEIILNNDYEQIDFWANVRPDSIVGEESPQHSIESGCGVSIDWRGDSCLACITAGISRDDCHECGHLWGESDYSC